MGGPVFYNRRRRSPVVVAAIALIALAVGVFAVARGDSQPEPDATPVPAANEAVPLEHVHGLGTNPTDGSLMVATHSGLFRVTGHGDAARVGSSFQDVMGFTVVGPDHFLASGHPDVAGIREGQPGQLGLIESRDGGGTWELVSLAGEADFHALAFGGGTVYGVNALDGRVKVSDDLRSWEDRSMLSAGSLAVNPKDASHVVATTESSLRESRDGGHTWTDLAGPKLSVVAWDTVLGLWGVTADGSAHHRAPATGEWVELDPLPGAPQAVSADGGTLYAAVHDADGRTEIYASTGGAWRQRLEAG
jgi:hypothetical protein